MADADATTARLWAWVRGRSLESEWDARFTAALPRVYNFIRYRVGDGTLAEDLTSITFEKAWPARERYRRDQAAFGTWLLTVARNVAIDHFRSAKPTVPLEEAEAVPGGPTPEDLAVRRSDGEHLGRLLARRPEREREILALKYGAECTNREIARLTGLSESNVGTILHRAVTALRVDWDKERDDG
jgi:RNA polymerase sigma-70 factor (ECF subfamily)